MDEGAPMGRRRILIEKQGDFNDNVQILRSAMIDEIYRSFLKS
jgi:hypothetical protein